MRRLVSIVPLLLAACASPTVMSGKVTTERGEFVVCGDSRGPLEAEWTGLEPGRVRREIFARLAEEAPDFVVNTGDLVAAGGLSSLWRAFDEGAAPLREKSIAYFPVLGNHDLWPDAQSSLANWFARFPALGGRRWYDVRYRDVSLLFVDTNSDHLTDVEVAAQSDWFRAMIAAADQDPAVRCVLVVCHHSPFTNCFASGRSEWVRTQFVDPARASRKVKAFFSGHVHSYEHFLEEGIHFVVSGGGGAPLMKFDPDVKFRDLYHGPRSYHFCRVIPRADRLDVEIVMMADDFHWSVADAWSIPLR